LAFALALVLNFVDFVPRETQTANHDPGKRTAHIQVLPLQSIHSNVHENFAFEPLGVWQAAKHAMKHDPPVEPTGNPQWLTLTLPSLAVVWSD
jgi:hypothetical protein